MKRLLVFALIISAVTLAGYWTGRKVCMMMWPGSLNPAPRWYANLGLDREQADVLRAKDAAFRSMADGMCVRVCRGRLELLALMGENGSSQDKVLSKIDEVGALQVALEKEIAAHILAVRENLTPEQSAAYLARVREKLHDSIRRTGYTNVLAQEGKASV